MSEIRGLDLPAVRRWLAENVEGADATLSFELVAAGGSNLTYVVERSDGFRWALRRPPERARIATAHEMAREWRIIAALHAHPECGVPVPEAIAFCEDTEVTGAEDKIVERCATPEVAKQFQQAFDDYQDLVTSQGVNLMGSQPTEGNIRGGLTTIEEKALGNVEKAGQCTVVGYLDQAQPPAGPPGLYFMDSSSAAAEHVTLCCAAGAVLHLFTTG